MSRDFPGTNTNYLNLGGNPTGLNILGTALTIHAWIKPNTLGTHIFSKDVTGDRQYVLGSNTVSGRSEHVVGNGVSTTDVCNGTIDIPIGSWSSIGMVKVGTGAGAFRSFLNGALDNAITSNVSIGQSDATTAIGARNGTSAFFNGEIAEVSVWAASLTDGEMFALGKGASPLTIRPLSLRGYWPLWGTASPERDYSEVPNSATVTGTVPAGATHPPVMPFIPPHIPSDFGGFEVTPMPTAPFPPLSKSMAALLRR